MIKLSSENSVIRVTVPTGHRTVTRPFTGTPRIDREKRITKPGRLFRRVPVIIIDCLFLRSQPSCPAKYGLCHLAPGQLCQSLEALRIVHCHLSQHLPVDLHTCQLQAVHKFTV